MLAFKTLLQVASSLLISLALTTLAHPVLELDTSASLLNSSSSTSRVASMPPQDICQIYFAGPHPNPTCFINAYQWQTLIGFKNKTDYASKQPEFPDGGGAVDIVMTELSFNPDTTQPFARGCKGLSFTVWEMLDCTDSALSNMQMQFHYDENNECTIPPFSIGSVSLNQP